MQRMCILPSLSLASSSYGRILYDQAIADGLQPDVTIEGIKAFMQTSFYGHILYDQAIAAGLEPNATIASVKAYINSQGKKVHDGSILYNQSIAANDTPDLANPSVKAYSDCHGKKVHDGSILYNQSIAANDTPDVANPSVKAYSDCYGKKIHDTAIETCKSRKIELAELEQARKRAAEEASGQAPAAESMKRSFRVRCGWCNGPERSTPKILTPATFNGTCECGGKRKDGQKRKHRYWLY